MDRTKIPLSCSLAALRHVWPEAIPFLGLGGLKGRALVALAFSEVEWAAAWQGRLACARVVSGAPPFRSGLMGVLSYDDLTRQAPSKAAPSRIFRVERVLEIDLDGGTCRLLGNGTKHAADFVVDDEAALDLVARATRWRAPAATGLGLDPDAGDEAYRQLVRHALQDIRDGRYYQVNLLRYFQLRDACSEELAARWQRTAGPFGAWLHIPGELEIISFSPERFVHIEPQDEHLRLGTWPVKGTAARGEDAVRDAAAVAALAGSRKDRAELAMIVDLMRNDMYRIALPGTVKVLDPARVVVHPTVLHLEAEVEALIPGTLNFGELLRALCPAGSITGAPKLEAMRAIREYEGRDRGYFMGHAFYLDDTGAFDSSVLIRTVVKQRENPYEFAAGSGIVVMSDPEAERREIATKAQVLTAPLYD